MYGIKKKQIGVANYQATSCNIKNLNLNRFYTTFIIFRTAILFLQCVILRNSVHLCANTN